MKTSAVSAADFARSIIAVPPLARSGDLTVGCLWPPRPRPRAAQRRSGSAETIRATCLPLENLRDAGSPIRVLHEAVTLVAIADMGAMLPQLSNIAADEKAAVAAAAKALLAHDRTLH